MAYPYDGMFYPTLPEDTQDFGQVLSGVGRNLRDFGRGVSYFPMDLAGMAADIGNYPLQGIDYLVNQIRGTDQNYLSTERPFGGSAQLIDVATKLGLSQQPTGSAPETLGRVMAGLINPMAGARAVGRAGEITTEQANRAADALVRQITGNPEATAPAVLEAAGGMVPLSRMFKPEQVKAILPETKAVDASGNPVMVYHGTADPIEQFSKSKLGESTRAQSAKQGFFFQDNPSYARNYADYAANEARVQTLVDKAYAAEKKGDWDGYDKFLRQAEELESSFRKDYGAGQNIYPAYLDMKNPFVFDAKGESYTYIEDSLTNIIKKAKKQGHDGVIFRNLDDIPGKTNAISDHYVVFEPEQIKSAVSDPAFAGLLEPQAGAKTSSKKWTEEEIAVFNEQKLQKQLMQAKEQDRLSQENKQLAKKFIEKLPSMGVAKDFTKDQLDSISYYRLAGDRKGAMEEGASQTVNLLEKKLKDMGVQIVHKSNIDGGNSIYANVNGKIVRISDHYLPETSERLYKGNKWDNEVITYDWANTNLDDYLKRITSPVVE